MTVGLIGLGAMGTAMAERLLEDGHRLVVWNRTSARADALLDAGATWAASPMEMVRRCEIILLSLLDQHAIEQVVFGPSGIAAAPRLPARLIVDTSTCDPEWTRDTADRLHRQNGVDWVDAPVSGGVPGARAGRLTMFLGGSDRAVEALTPLLPSIAAHHTHMGPLGAGQVTKLFNQMLVAGALVTIAETVALATRAGVDGAKLAGALRGGFADSSPLQIFAPRMAARDFKPVQSGINLFAKDLDLAARLAGSLRADFSVSAAHRAILARADGVSGPSPDADISELIGLFQSAVTSH